ncbi:hypothetical protein N7507_001364 [Penicillium longicatenatum]|jgi:hypothetical protein|nr:hypothetical protein N7507_001364 [Penicillium longicatenatum]
MGRPPAESHASALDVGLMDQNPGGMSGRNVLTVQVKITEVTLLKLSPLCTTLQSPSTQHPESRIRGRGGSAHTPHPAPIIENSE